MTTAMLGVGMMGEAMLAGLLHSGWDPSTLRAVDAQESRQNYISEKYGVPVMSLLDAVAESDEVIVVVKPNNVAEVLNSVSPVLKKESLIISLAAGLTTSTLERHLPASQPVIRAMPNTASLVGEGMTVICTGSCATGEHVARAETILACVGKVKLIPEELIDAVTAIAGSGPAYIMYVAESMIDTGVMMGLPRAMATELVKQTLYGSSKLLAQSNEHPTTLKENVVSPGGATAAALRIFEERCVKAAFTAAIEAAFKRSGELGAQ
jgi:pyrroline-5-carboxylate reductase